MHFMLIVDIVACRNADDAPNDSRFWDTRNQLHSTGQGRSVRKLIPTLETNIFLDELIKEFSPQLPPGGKSNRGGGELKVPHT